MSQLTRYSKLNFAENFKYAFDEDSPDNLYVFVGKIYDWPGNTAPTILDNDKETQHDIWKDVIFAKRITENDIHHVIPRYDWTANTFYNHYVHDNVTIYSNTIPFYVRSSAGNVYKCIANSGYSLVEPTGQSTEEFTTSDGYTWKFMYNITTALSNKFQTNTYIPVQISTNDEEIQYNVQEAAIVGDIKHIDVDAGGSNYLTDAGNFSQIVSNEYLILDGSASSTTNAYRNYSIFITSGTGAGQLRKIIEYDGSLRRVRVDTPFTVLPDIYSQYVVSPSVVINGNGSDATARSVVDSNGTDIDSIIMVSRGSNYTLATATIQGETGSGAILKPIISPPGGHGFNAIHELNGINIMIDKQIINDESGKITVNNDFRVYGLVKNPLLSSNGAIAAADTYDQTQKITLVNVSNAGAFLADERVYATNSNTTTFNVVEFANTNASNTAGILSVTNANNAALLVGETIRGNDSGVIGVVSNVQEGALERSTGTIIFIGTEDVGVIRDALQSENFKITFSF